MIQENSKPLIFSSIIKRLKKRGTTELKDLKFTLLEIVAINNNIQENKGKFEYEEVPEATARTRSASARASGGGGAPAARQARARAGSALAARSSSA